MGFCWINPITKFQLRPEEAILKVVDINTDWSLSTKKQLQYTIENDTMMAEVFATEKFYETLLV